MMFKKFITVFSLIFLINISSAFAKEINIDVNGLVCEFCVVTIEKNFNKRDEIKMQCPRFLNKNSLLN